MPEAVKFLALVALLVLGAWGWGAAAVAALGRAGWASARDELRAPLQLVIGVSLFLAAGGILVALDAARLPFLLGWHVIGAALLLPRIWAGTRRFVSPDARTLVGGLALAAGGLFLLLVSLGLAIGYVFYNQYDDDPAYIYLAKRLLGTGGLIDPFNARRMTSYGGATLYHALFLDVTGNSSIRGFEFTFAVVLLVVVTVGTFRRRWIALGTVVLGIGVMAGHSIGPIQNLSPTLSAAALSLATYQLLGKVRRAPDADQPWLFVVIGVVLGGILALRFYYLFSVVVAAIIAIVFARRRRAIRAVAVCGLAGLLSVAGWAVASYRSSRTPLFPLVEGNYDPSYPVGPNPFAGGVGEYLRHLGSVINGYGVGWVAIGCIGIAVGALVIGRRARTDPNHVAPLRHPDRQELVVLLGAGIGCLVQLVVYTVVFSGFAGYEIDRFEGPSTLACGLFAVHLFWPCRDPAVASARPRRAPRHAPTTRRGPLRRLGPTVPWRVPARLALGTFAVVGLTCVMFGGTPRSYWDATRSNVRNAWDILQGSSGFVDRYVLVEKEYRRMNRTVPRGATVLAAVDEPSLLSFSRFHFATLDLAGAASPAPHMPYFRGAAAKATYLRRLGYQYILADASTGPGLYDLDAWRQELHAPQYNYRSWAPYYFDWAKSITDLEHDGRHRVRYVGTLALIEIGAG